MYDAPEMSVVFESPGPDIEQALTRALDAMDEWERRYEAASPEERERMNEEAIQMMADFVVNGPGGP